MGPGGSGWVQVGPGGSSASSDSNICRLQVLTKKKLQDLVREIDPNEQLDEDVEEVRLCSGPVLVSLL